MGTNGQLGNGGEDDLLEPTVIKSKQVDSRRVIAASAGGQHTILLAVDGQPEPESSSSKPNWFELIDFFFNFFFLMDKRPHWMARLAVY